MRSIYLPYTLKLQSRAVVTGIGGDPNSAVTLHYIPGSSIRGAFAARANASIDGAQLIETLILSDHVRYLNAYPVVGTTRSFPIPVSWRSEKYDRAAVHDLAAVRRSDPERPAVALGGGPAEFVSLGDALPRTVNVSTSAQVHQQRDRVRGRAWRTEDDEGLGAVFVYESIDAGQMFGGVIQVRDEAAVAALRELLPAESIVRVGRSRLSGYGGEAILKWGKPRGREVEDPSVVIRAGDRFRAVLTSSYIGRNEETGQVDPEALMTELAARCGDFARIAGVHWTFDRVAAFDRTWQLRLPEVPVARAGSVVVLEALKDIDEDLLASLEDQGLGERRNEGFGRLLVLPPAVPNVNVAAPEDVRLPAFRAERYESLTVSKEAVALLGTMGDHILAEHAHRSIEMAAAQIRVTNIPPRSLLGRLLVPLTRDPRTALDTLTTWLHDGDEHALKEKARKRLDQCRVTVSHQTMNLRDALRSLASGDATEFETLIGAGEVIRRGCLVDEKAARRWFHDHLPELRRQLIVRLLASMQKESVLRERGRKPPAQEVAR
ncbi:MAG TPA: hypothetical protein VGJ81_00820 [Thermoanaerobaculia bacterium]|jgi:CRISPR-associated protein Csx10